MPRHPASRTAGKRERALSKRTACEGVILDLDGTLANTLRDITESVNTALSGMRLPTVTGEAVRQFVGEGLPMLCRRALGNEHLDKLDQMLSLVTEQYRLHDLDHTVLYDGVAEMLDGLTARGIPMAVLSNKLEHATRRTVAALCSRWTFVAVEGFRDEESRKPNPRVPLEIVGRMNAIPSEVWMVGDSQTDIATARAAGLVAVAATWGFRDRDVLEALGPDHVIDRPTDLLALLQP
jgi:phosphoglycolate phosphatase